MLFQKTCSAYLRLSALLRGDDIALAIRHGLDLNFEQFAVAHGAAEHLCCDFDEVGHPTPGGLARAERFIARARNWTPVAWWLYGLGAGVKVIARMIACTILDHDLVSEDWAGPESGGMGASCSRCGWGFSHTLY